MSARERLARLLVDQHDYHTWEGCNENLRDGFRLDADEVLAVVVDVDEIAGVLHEHVFGTPTRPAHVHFWLPTCSCGWVASTRLEFDQRRHQAEAIAAHLRGTP